MAVPVDGKDVILTAFNEGVGNYLDFACTKGVQVTVNTPVAPTTTADSGFWETFKPTGLSNWSISFTGIIFVLDLVTNRNFIFDLLTEQVMLNGLQIRVVFTDRNGGGAKSLTGFVYVPSTVLGGDAGQLAHWLSEMQGSGPLQINAEGATPFTPGEVFSDWWQTIPGEYTISGLSAIHGYSLVGKTVLEVKKEGLEHDLVTGAPSGRQARFTQVSGVVDFDTSIVFNPNETVFVIFK